MTLRLLTWNVMCMAAIEHNGLTIGVNRKEEALARAAEVVRSINSLPAVDRPDVIVFNEVSMEVVREFLWHKLVQDYPQVIPKVDYEPGNLQATLPEELLARPKQDAGLMLFSRLPFLPMRDALGSSSSNTFFHSVIFRDARGADTLANKGAGMVMVQSRSGPVIVVFTHMQASYDKPPTENDDVRRSQLSEILNMMKIAAGADPRHWITPVILAGDLNVPGPTETRPKPVEFERLFRGAPPPPLGADFPLRDGWDRHMPPESLGYTYQRGERLDYIVIARTIERQYAAQHMRPMFRGIPDHFALWGSLARETEFCAPAAPWKGAADPGHLAVAETLQTEPGRMLWMRFDEPGTYSWFQDDPQISVNAFLARDIGTEWPGYAGLVHALDQYPANVGQELRERRMGGPGRVVCIPEGPWFLRVRAAEPDLEQLGGLRLAAAVLRHAGRTPAEAISLPPYVTIDPRMPADKKLNPEDTVWLRADPPADPSGRAHRIVFMIENETGRDIRVALRVDPGAPPAREVTSAERVVELEHESSGEPVFLTITRIDFDQTQFSVTYRHTLTCLKGDDRRPLKLRCVDETGLDIAGGDEIRLSLFLDGDPNPALLVERDDVDSGEEIHLGDARFWFSRECKVEVRETGDIDGDDIGTGAVAPLDGGATTAEASVSMKVATGRYVLSGRLARMIDGVA